MLNKIRINRGDFYREYKGPLSATEYAEVCKAYYKNVIDAIIIDNILYSLPKLGTLRLSKQKQRLEFGKDNKLKLSVNYAASKKYGKAIYYTNEHTNGYIFKIDLDRRIFRNNKSTKFKPGRYTFSRYLAKLIKSDDYLIDAPLG